MSMHRSRNSKSRGRTANARPRAFSPTKAALEVEKRTESTRPIGAGGGKNRGDRRDTNPQFTGARKKKLMNTRGDPLGSGKKQIQAGGKARKGGGKKQKGTYDQALAVKR